jgi:hypothetical protein
MYGPGLSFIVAATARHSAHDPQAHATGGSSSSQEFELKKIIVIALALGSLSLTAGLAVAAQFVGNGGSIQGCVLRNGVLAVVKAGKRWPRHSTPLPFNQVGPQGRQGIQGVQGPQGVEGIPGPVTTTAPSGTTQRGFFDIDGYTTCQDLGTSITFPLELSASPKVVEVRNDVPNPAPTHCAGSPQAPSAAPGYLCLYDRYEANVGQAVPGEYLQVDGADERFGDASPFGARLTVVPQTTGEVLINGSWAVTAP